MIIRNTSTAHWTIHIAFLQAVVGELYAARTAGMGAADVAALDARIAKTTRAAIDQTAEFLKARPEAQAHVFARELTELADKLIAESLAVIKGIGET